jgi:transcriptional regulator with XRE-family HTH domain
MRWDDFRAPKRAFGGNFEMARKRKHPIRADVIERLRESRGLSLDRLAAKARMDITTLRRILRGRETYLTKIQALAEALSTTSDALRADIQPEDTGVVTRFSLDLGLNGVIPDASKLNVLVQLTPKIIALLAEHGIKISDHKAILSVSEYSGNELQRTIALVFGVLATGAAFWSFVAVKTYMYPLFIEQQKRGKVEMDNFDPWGEIITCGEGTHPGDDIVVKVAQLYQSDPLKLLAFVNDEKPKG